MVSWLTRADYLVFLKRRGWIVALIAVVVTAAAIGVSLQMTKQYRSTIHLSYQRSNLDQTVLGMTVFSSLDMYEASENGTLLIDSVADSVVKDLGLKISHDTLLSRLQTLGAAGSNTVDLRAVSRSPSEAAKIAEAYARAFVAYRAGVEQAKVAATRDIVKAQVEALSASDAATDTGVQLRAKLTGLESMFTQSVSGFRIVGTASVPTKPVSPRIDLNAIRGLVGGIILGLGVALLVEFLIRRRAQAASRP